MDNRQASRKVGVESFSNRNLYVMVSFILGFLTGLITILAGSDYYFAGWPSHGAVGILGIFLWILGFLTILSSFLVLIQKVRVIGAVLVLVFGLFSNMLGLFVWANFATFLLPLGSFIFGIYAAKWAGKS